MRKSYLLSNNEDKECLRDINCKQSVLWSVIMVDFINNKIL